MFVRYVQGPNCAVAHFFTLQTPIREDAQRCKDDFKDDAYGRRDSLILPTRF
jgi:hypothetical protein